MSVKLVLIRHDTYVDSVLLMSISRTMREAEGSEWAAALMGTEANLEDLRSQGFEDDLASAGANDLVLAVRADSRERAEAAISAGQEALGPRERPAGSPQELAPWSLAEAVSRLPDANIALVSVPGEYAALEAHKALSAGLHVLLFSDNVPLEDEVALKERGAALGRFVMGPGAGTAFLGGAGLGFANVVERGPVGIVAAAGTGAQEAMSLLGRWGAGVSEVIGVGGRDLRVEVGGRMTRMALRALEEDPRTRVLLLVSKPPSPEVASDLLGQLREGKPAVAALIGFRERAETAEGVRLARTLEEGVRLALEILGIPPPDTAEGMADAAKSAMEGLDDGRRSIRGLFAGGAVCYESMGVMSKRLGAVHSNTPLQDGWGLPAPPGAHACLDLGEEEFTRGRPHPMIDLEPRADRIIEESSDPSVGVILVDVVLGHGAHEDPASALAAACEEARRRGVAVVAYVLGTDADPQGYRDQRAAMERAGSVVAPTGARAALLAAAIAAREPEMAEETP